MAVSPSSEPIAVTRRTVVPVEPASADRRGRGDVPGGPCRTRCGRHRATRHDPGRRDRLGSPVAPRAPPRGPADAGDVDRCARRGGRHPRGLVGRRPATALGHAAAEPLAPGRAPGRPRCAERRRGRGDPGQGPRADRDAVRQPGAAARRRHRHPGSPRRPAGRARGPPRSSGTPSRRRPPTRSDTTRSTTRRTTDPGRSATRRSSCTTASPRRASSGWTRRHSGSAA